MPIGDPMCSTCGASKNLCTCGVVLRSLGIANNFIPPNIVDDDIESLKQENAKLKSRNQYLEKVKDGYRGEKHKLQSELDALKQQTQWISVEDDLPKEYESVVVRIKSYMCDEVDAFGFYSCGEWSIAGYERANPEPKIMAWTRYSPYKPPDPPNTDKEQEDK